MRQLTKTCALHLITLQNGLLNERFIKWTEKASKLAGKPVMKLTAFSKKV